MNKTNWTAYYGHKKSFFSTYTQKYTYKRIKEIFSLYSKSNGKNQKLSVVEFGGGNSCFADRLCIDFQIDEYIIVDNNALACDMSQAKGYRTLCVDLLSDSVSEKFDIVLSIGLVEHFNFEDRKTIIAKHFDSCRNGGLVIISFPTPTKKYCRTRRFMEMIHVWQFYDEQPFWGDEIKADLRQFGEIIYDELNKDLPLTQTILAIRKMKDLSI